MRTCFKGSVSPDKIIILKNKYNIDGIYNLKNIHRSDLLIYTYFLSHRLCIKGTEA